MREIRTSGSVEGVTSDRHSYSDYRAPQRHVQWRPIEASSAHHSLIAESLQYVQQPTRVPQHCGVYGELSVGNERHSIRSCNSCSA